MLWLVCAINVSFKFEVVDAAFSLAITLYQLEKVETVHNLLGIGDGISRLLPCSLIMWGLRTPGDIASNDCRSSGYCWFARQLGAIGEKSFRAFLR